MRLELNSFSLSCPQSSTSVESASPLHLLYHCLIDWRLLLSQNSLETISSPNQPSCKGKALFLVSGQQWIQVYFPARKALPNEEWSVSASKLFCRACHECVAVKHSIVSHQVKSTEPIDSKKWLLQKEARGSMLTHRHSTYYAALGAVGVQEGGSSEKGGRGAVLVSYFWWNI